MASFQDFQGITVEKLLELNCHKEFIEPTTQLDYYINNNASPEILKYVVISGKSFGEKYMERLAKEYFNLNNRISSTHDHIKLNKKIEQKSARYHANGNDWKWQHIELSHEWDYLLLCGLGFESIQFYITSREIVETLVRQNIIVGQGKKIDGISQPQQAYWFSRNDFTKNNINFTDYFKPIMNEDHLIEYLNST